MLLSRKIIFLSIALYIASLPQVCFETKHWNNNIDAYYGFLILPFGIFGSFRWFANVFYAVTLYFYFKKEHQEKIVTLSFIGAIIATSFYFCESIIADDTGREHKIINLCLGYYCWLSAMIVSFIGICISLIKYDKK